MDRKYMDIEEFSREGYLQEVNRLLLHPCGLALEVVRLDPLPLRSRPGLALRAAYRGARDILLGRTAGSRLSGVWDHRDDPEGCAFGFEPDREKAARVLRQWHSKRGVRLRGLGYHVQPPLGGDVAHPRVDGDSAEWRRAVEKALGVEEDPVHHTPEWAFGLVRAVRELGNGGRQ